MNFELKFSRFAFYSAGMYHNCKVNLSPKYAVQATNNLNALPNTSSTLSEIQDSVLIRVSVSLQ